MAQMNGCKLRLQRLTLIYVPVCLLYNISLQQVLGSGASALYMARGKNIARSQTGAGILVESPAPCTVTPSERHSPKYSRYLKYLLIQTNRGTI